jgi:hypothetical protein
MRWLFLIVLFLNLAYIAWHAVRPVTQPYENVQPLKNVRPIVLLSELKHQQADVIAAAQTSSLHNNDVNKQQEELTRPEVNNEKQPLPPLQIAEAVEVTEVAPVKKSEEIRLPALTSGKDRVEADKVVDIKQLETSNELQEKPLMSKDGRPDSRYGARSQEGDAIMSKDEQHVAGSQEVATVQKASCFTMGPFQDLDKLRRLTREIKPYVVATDFRGHEEREHPLYWVYIKPEKNRKKAVATGKRLSAKKIKDFYVIREGEKIHGISLGRFRNKNGAYGLAKKAQKLGFDAIVEPVFKTFTIYWLDYQLADGVTIPDAFFEQYTQATKKGKVSYLPRECNN